MESFPFTLGEVLQLLQINFTSKQNARIKCPFCSGKKIVKDLGINFDSEIFHCFSCGVSGRGGTQFYAYHQNLTTQEAYKEIMASLGLNNETAPKIRERVVTPKEVIIEAPTAPADVLNKTNRNLLDELPLLDCDKELLLARGFKEFEIFALGYKSYPSGDPNSLIREYFNIPKKLIAKGCKLSGVPGFYKTSNKKVWTMVWRKAGILVPYVSYENKILGFQLRKHDSELDYNAETGEKENKYSCISSVGKNEGAKLVTSVHYACDFEWDKETRSFSPIIPNGVIGITEGAMKADLYHCITGNPLVAIPGVGVLCALKSELIRLKKEKGVHTVAILHDMDYLTNPNVKKDIDKLYQLIDEVGLKVVRPTWETMLNGQDVLKGIDDYYAYHERNIIPIIKKSSE